MHRRFGVAGMGIAYHCAFAMAGITLLCTPVCLAVGKDGSGVMPSRDEKILSPSPTSYPELTFHTKPRMLHKRAIVEDWPTRLGPHYNNISRERPLLKAWPKDGLTMVWEMETGNGFAAPAIRGDRLVFFHRIGDEETVDCLEADTGRRFWRYQYPTKYEDKYGFNNGPRCGPVIDGDRVYTHGVEGVLTCISLHTGEVHWTRHTSKEFSVPQDYFGVGSAPLVFGKLLIVQVGAPAGPTVVAFDKMTGDIVWKTASQWTSGYATPTIGTFSGKPKIVVFTGGESDPPTGGLLTLDPTNGNIDFRFPFRSKNFISVNASTPVIHDERVFISSAYKTGGVLLDPTRSGDGAVVWRTDDMRCHFMTPVLKDGHLYGVDGMSKSNTAISCIDFSTGKGQWRKPLNWVDSVNMGGKTRELDLPFGDGSLIFAEGLFIALGQYGHLAILDLSPAGCRELSHFSPFIADETFTSPILSHGLLYVCQNKRGLVDKSPPKLYCFDLRAEKHPS